MLKKEICKKCRKRLRIRWDGYDEKYWKEGVIYCPLKYIEDECVDRKTTDKPPIKCPYYLENLL